MPYCDGCDELNNLMDEVQRLKKHLDDMKYLCLPQLDEDVNVQLTSLFTKDSLWRIGLGAPQQVRVVIDNAAFCVTLTRSLEG